MMFRPFPAIPVVGALVAAALLAAACSSGGGSAAPTGLEKTKLNVAAVPALASAGLYIAQQRGLFAAQGLHATIVSAPSSGSDIAGQLAGTYDVTEGAYVAYMLADARQNANLKVLAPASNMGPLTQEVMVPPGSPIQTVSELRGKTIGLNALNNVGEVLVSSLLTDNGGSPRTTSRRSWTPWWPMGACRAPRLRSRPRPATRCSQTRHCSSGPPT